MSYFSCLINNRKWNDKYLILVYLSENHFFMNDIHIVGYELIEVGAGIFIFTQLLIRNFKITIYIDCNLYTILNIFFSKQIMF